MFESRKFEKVKWSNIVKRVPKKYFSYLIDKIILLISSPDFYVVLVIIFVNSIYQPCIPS